MAYLSCSTGYTNFTRTNIGLPKFAPLAKAIRSDQDLVKSWEP